MHRNPLRHFVRRSTRYLCPALLLCATGLASAASPVILEANVTGTSLKIVGTDLQHKDPAKHPTVVALGSVRLLTTSVTAKMVLAQMPAAIPPGSYLLTVDTGEGPGDRRATPGRRARPDRKVTPGRKVRPDRKATPGRKARLDRKAKPGCKVQPDRQAAPGRRARPDRKVTPGREV
jgi:hypothetical protein